MTPGKCIGCKLDWPACNCSLPDGMIAEEPKVVYTDYFSDQLLKELSGSVDNGTMHVTVETPDGWKCDKPNCTTDFLHKHATYDCLYPKP